MGSGVTADETTRRRVATDVATVRDTVEVGHDSSPSAQATALEQRHDSLVTGTEDRPGAKREEPGVARVADDGVDDVLDALLDLDVGAPKPCTNSRSVAKAPGTGVAGSTKSEAQPGLAVSQPAEATRAQPHEPSIAAATEDESSRPATAGGDKGNIRESLGDSSATREVPVSTATPALGHEGGASAADAGGGTDELEDWLDDMLGGD